MKEKMVKALRKGVEIYIHLQEEIPVHLLYWTAWITEDGTLHFREDIYGRDEMLDKALKNCFSSEHSS